MKIKEKKIKGTYEIILDPHEDHRGFFMRTYDDQILKKHNLNNTWVQENHSYSKMKGTLRGMHFQFPPYAETKIVRAVSGEIFMAFVDLRKNSKSFGKWDSIILSRENKKMLYVEKGIALGMYTLTNDCDLLYKMGNYYKPDKQGSIKWDDPDIKINWPIKGKPIVSEKDASAVSFKEFIKKYDSIEV